MFCGSNGRFVARSMITTYLILMVFFCIWDGAIAFGEVLKVPQEHASIQSAIASAKNGDVVLVADGVYQGEGNKNLNLMGKAITVQSQNGPQSTIIDCESDGRGFEVRTGEAANSVIKGFTIKNGNSFNGGGILCQGSSPTIADCIITNNVAYSGGGIACEFGSSPHVANCTITNNTSSFYGGGGISCSASSPYISSCRIIGNTSDIFGGGGLRSYDSLPTIVNSFFAFNKSNTGAALYFREHSDATVINCTIVSNSVTNGWDGAITCLKSSPAIINSILWGNTPNQIVVNSGSPSVTFSDVQGGWSGSGNISADPLFVDPNNVNYHLSSGSPCIDAGAAVEAAQYDFENDSRPQLAAFDIGADEYKYVEEKGEAIPVKQIAGCSTIPGQTAFLAAVTAAGRIYATQDLTNWHSIPGALNQITVADFNGDGKADIAGVTAIGQIFYTLDLSTWYFLPGTLVQISAADLNGDGKADIAGVTAIGQIYYTLDLSTWHYLPGTLAQITAADLNGDGRADIAGVTSIGEIYYTLDLGSWNYLPKTLAQITAADFNANGTADIAGLTDLGQIFYTFDLSNWNFLAGTLFQVTIADFNSDGKADVAGVTADGQIYYSLDLANWNQCPNPDTILSK